MYYLGVDLGKFVINAGVVSQDGKIIEFDSVPTLKYRDLKDVLKDMADLCRNVVKTAGLDMDKDIISIGVGSSGTTNDDNGEIIYSSYSEFYHFPIRTELSKYFNKPIYVENDANCYALLESRLGASKGYSSSVTTSIGNGIGCGIIIDGKIYSGAFNGAGEVGHQVIVFDGEPCSCGRRGCWEAYASATALVRDARIQAIKHPESLMFKKVNGDLRILSYKIPLEAARQGDIWAEEIVHLHKRYLAVGIINIINILQPEIIVLGGKLMEYYENFIEDVSNLVIKKIYGEKAHNKKYIPKIVMAEYTYTDAVIIGATMLKR